MTWHYPRAADMSSAGLTADPCLPKDTLQLAAFSSNNLLLRPCRDDDQRGRARLPGRLAGRALRPVDHDRGILGMSHKPGSDDTRSSLSYKLKRLLQFTGARVLCSDPYVTTDRALIPLPMVLSQAALLIIGTPHRDYPPLETKLPIGDIFNLYGRGIALFGSEAATVPLRSETGQVEAAVGEG